MRNLTISAALVLASAGAVSTLHADEVLFKNGDRISGTIVSADEGELVLKSDVAGKITIKMTDVATFSTTGPVTLQLQDNTQLNQPVTTGESGQVNLQQGTVQAQPVAMDNIKRINPEAPNWKGSITVGGMLERGNSRTDSLNVDINAVRRSENDRITLGAGYRFGRQREPGTGDIETSTDNWFMGGKYDYFLDKKWYVYASTRVERDRIAGLDLRMTPGGGVGYQWIETKQTSFSTEAGLAWLYEDYRGADSTSAIAARLAYSLSHQLNDKVALFHDVEFFPSLEDIHDYLILADAGVRADLTETMFSEFKFQLKHDSSPAPGASRSDLRYVVGIGWRF